MSRWEERELKALEQMRSALKKEKAAHIPYPDGITDTHIFQKYPMQSIVIIVVT